MSSRPILRVAVSGLHLGENCQPGAGVIRSLREAYGKRIKVVGLGYDALDSGLHAEGLLDDAFLLPYPSHGPEAFVRRLEEIHATAPFDVLIPCLDVELPVLLRVADRLRELGIAFVAPNAGDLARCSKDRLPELAAACSVATPVTRRVVDVTGLTAAGRELGFPMVVKGPFYEADVVQGPTEAAASFARLAAKWGLPLLAQQFVAGEEFNVIALGDGEGGVHGPVAMRKTVITRLGKAWGGVTVEDDELTATATKLVAALRWRGGCEVEMLRARADGRLQLVEINPRFPAWVHLATRAGVNLPVGLVRLARGQRPPHYEAPTPGVWYVRHAIELFGDQSDLACLLATARRRGADSPELATEAAPRGPR